MCGGGLAFRGKKAFAKAGVGVDVYKGENIIATALTGEPQDKNVDISQASDMGIFRLGELLPKRCYAVAQITTCPNALPFNPCEFVFTNTATIFAPKDQFSAVPFDLLFVSRIYRYFYALECRMSYLNMMRSHVYPTNLRLLPWNDGLSLVAAELEDLRPALVSACENHFRTEAAMFAALDGLSLRKFRDVFKAQTKASGGKVEWSESLNKGTDKIELSGALAAAADGDGWHITLSGYMLDWVKVPDEASALGLAIALSARAGTDERMVDREALLNMPVPQDTETRAAYAAIVSQYRDADHAGAIEAVVDQIDALIGPALGLNPADLASIRQDMLEDPFLKNITPRWPATETRIHGYRTGLDSSERYS